MPLVQEMYSWKDVANDRAHAVRHLQARRDLGEGSEAQAKLLA